ncbi:hypothetical protein FOZ62_000360 [Perkinsus olseni]|uniref:Uncharacterized protein n=1 Tax=Perkinsus olseni TaxID=32597 RepID=A0A7J6RVI3_PEROL|nr:hypothetical protein FOZ62_000360 [Perkinsus olseni]
MVNLFSTSLIVTGLFVTTTCQRSGTFTHEGLRFTLTYVVDNAGEVSLTVERPARPAGSDGRPGRPGRRSSGESYPLKEVHAQLEPDGFLFSNYTVDFEGSGLGGKRSFLEPVSLLLPSVELEAGDLTDLSFFDGGIAYARFRGRDLGFRWNTLPLSPGVFRYRETTGDLNKLTYIVFSDGTVEMNVGCRGLDSVEAEFSLNEVFIDQARTYTVADTEESSLATFQKQVFGLCGYEDRDFFLQGIIFANEDRIYVPYLIPGRNSVLLPLDRIAN